MKCAPFRNVIRGVEFFENALLTEFTPVLGKTQIELLLADLSQRRNIRRRTAGCHELERFM